MSYRRTDSGGYAGWLHQLLVERFPGDEVFRDVDALYGGERWVERLDTTLARCDVLIAVIGPEWLAASNEAGRRLDDPEDRVRLELEAGIRRGIPLIPALVGGAKMPPQHELPTSLAALQEWQAVRLSDESWQHDLDQLAAAVERACEAAPGELQVGTGFAGHRIDALVGRGGMGIVYRARHLGLNRVDAIKVIAPELARSQEFRERFVRESQLAASIRHENVLTVYDAGEEGGLLYLTMQLVDGHDLGTMLAHSGPLSPNSAAEIVGGVAAALDAAHERGLVHRDVKPGNILIEERPGGRRQVYLGDFGLAREKISNTGLTSTGHWIGTADYVSPEQVMGEDVDERADIYALGCVLFEVLTGQVPYAGRSETAKLVAHATKDPPSLTTLRRGLPPELDQVVHTAMARDPARRYGSAARFTEALEAAIASPTAAPRKPRPPEAAALPSGDAEPPRHPPAPSREVEPRPPDAHTGGPPVPVEAVAAGSSVGPGHGRSRRRTVWLSAGVAVAIAVVLVVALLPSGSTPRSGPGTSSAGTPAGASSAVQGTAGTATTSTGAATSSAAVAAGALGPASQLTTQNTTGSISLGQTATFALTDKGEHGPLVSVRAVSVNAHPVDQDGFLQGTPKGTTMVAVVFQVQSAVGADDVTNSVIFGGTNTQGNDNPDTVVAGPDCVFHNVTAGGPALTAGKLLTFCLLYSAPPGGHLTQVTAMPFGTPQNLGIATATWNLP